MHPLFRKIFFIVAGIIFLVVATILVIHLWIINSSSKEVYSDTKKIPPAYTALVLGTSHKVVGGNENLYFTYRIKAATQLYNDGVVNKIIVSGDNSTLQYNEPREMRKALIKNGVPDSCIVFDFAGFRTFDSVVRSKEVFGQDTIIIVSQLFHLQRALFIAKQKDITAYGYIADDPNGNNSIPLREYFARVSAFIDCFVLHTRPKYLGEEINI